MTGTRHTPNRVHVVRRRVDFPPPTPQSTPCVLWQGSVDRDGYGRFKRYVGDKRETVRVTRWVMEQATGRKLRPDEFILHACDNPPCFRVDHLSIGSAADNNARHAGEGSGDATADPPLPGGVPSDGEADGGAGAQRSAATTSRGCHRRPIAQMFDVSPQTISKIVNGVLWASGDSQQ